MSEKKRRPFDLCLDQALAARMANCRHSACEALSVPHGPQLPIYVCAHPNRPEPQACVLAPDSDCVLRDDWFDHERIEVA